MRRTYHQAAVFFFFLAVLVLIRLPFGSYRDRALTELQNALSPLGVRVELSKFMLDPPAVISLERLSFLFPTNFLPVPFLIDDGSLAFSPIGLLTLRASGDGTLHLYRGTVDFDFEKSLFGNEVELASTLKSISLAQHPFLGSFGVSGLLDGQFEGNLQQAGNGAFIPTQGSALLQIREGKFQGGLKLFQLISLPQVDRINLAATCSFDQQTLALSNISLDSSLGNFKGKGKLRRKVDLQSGLQLMNGGKITGEIKLTESGKTIVGGYLALAAQQAGIPVPIDNPPTHWDIEIPMDQQGYFLPPVIKPHETT